MGIENTKHRQYLLRNLPDEEAEETELKIISDERLEEELALAEHDLMEDYLDGDLSANETDLFHQNFLVSDERKNELKYIRLLKKYTQVEGSVAEQRESQSSMPEAFGHRFYRFLLDNLRPASVALSIIILGLAVAAGLRIFFFDTSVTERAALENEFTELNRKDLRDLTLFQNLSTETLAPGTFRSQTGAGNLSAVELTDKVLFRLVLPVGMAQEGTFSAHLVKEDNVIFSVDGIPIYSNQSGKELRVILPSFLFKKGDYKIKIAPEDSGDPVIVYPFNVQ